MNNRLARSIRARRRDGYSEQTDRGADFLRRSRPAPSASALVARMLRRQRKSARLVAMSQFLPRRLLARQKHPAIPGGCLLTSRCVGAYAGCICARAGGTALQEANSNMARKSKLVRRTACAAAAALLAWASGSEAKVTKIQKLS